MHWSHTEQNLPSIVILGRTNTGKSTLFNRLLQKRRAITDPTPGVTRDPIEAVTTLNGRQVRLVDTGGFSLDEDVILRLVKEKTFGWLKNADLILFVMDIEETTKEDEEFLHQLHPYRDKIILVLNKMDTAHKDLLVYEKYQLGFKRLVGISAEHGRNFKMLLQEIDLFLAGLQVRPTEGGDGHDTPMCLSLLGRPNTGKSTLINAILGHEKSIVSEIPGTTRDVIEGMFHFRKKTMRILDTAGIRRKNRIDEPIEYYSVNRAIKTIDESDVVILLVDATAEFSEQDKKIAGLVLDRGKGLVVCLNKWDLVEKLPNRLQAVKDRIEFLFPDAVHLPLIPVSAKTTEGIEKILTTALHVNEEMYKRVDTGELNRALETWKAKFNIPLKKNTRIRYMTQTGIHPAHFVLFVNARRGFPQSYLQYLKNRLREEFGFRHVPIQIEIRKAVKSNP